MTLAIREVLNAHLAGLAIQQTHHQFLASAASAGDLCFLILVHETRKSADESLVGFDWTISAELIETAALHRLADAVKHEPCGRLSDAERTTDFIAANAVLAVDDLPHSDHPLVQSERAILEDRTDFDGELALGMSVLALPQSARGQKANDFTSAGRALNAIGPAQFAEQGERSVAVREVADRFHQGSGPCDLVVHDLNPAEMHG